MPNPGTLAALALAATLAAAGPGAAGPPEDDFAASLAAVRAASVPDADELLDTLRGAAGVQEKLAALDRLALRAGGLSADQQFRAVLALRDVFDSQLQPAMVRGRSMVALGRMSPWLKSPGMQRRAVEVLIEAAAADNPADSRTELRVYSLMGLAEAVGRLPAGDPQLEELAAAACLDGLRGARQASEKALAMRALHNLLQGRGAGPFLRSPDLALRLDMELVMPLESDLDGLYASPRETLDYRYHLARSLCMVARSWTAGEQLRHRIRQVLDRMARRDPEPRLAELARLYADLLSRGR